MEMRRGRRAVWHVASVSRTQKKSACAHDGSVVCVHERAGGGQ